MFYDILRDSLITTLCIPLYPNISVMQEAVQVCNYRQKNVVRHLLPRRSEHEWRLWNGQTIIPKTTVINRKSHQIHPLTWQIASMTPSVATTSYDEIKSNKKMSTYFLRRCVFLDSLIFLDTFPKKILFCSFFSRYRLILG